MLLRAGRASHATHAPWPRQLTLGAHFSRAGQRYRDRIRTMVLPDKQDGYTGPYRLGLTGSIGMGKTTVGQMFADLKVPLLDADASVHELYARGGAAVSAVQRLFPDAVVDGAVDRSKLGQFVLGEGNEAYLAQLEAAIHPLVEAQRDTFLQESASAGHSLVVLDIPLLFEKGLENAVDAVLVVSAPAEVQRRRVLARPGMTAEKFEAILSKQVPDEEKRQRAALVLDTSKDTNFTRIEVAELVHQLHSRYPVPQRSAAS